MRWDSFIIHSTRMKNISSQIRCCYCLIHCLPRLDGYLVTSRFAPLTLAERLKTGADFTLDKADLVHRQVIAPALVGNKLSHVDGIVESWCWGIANIHD